MWFLLVVAHLEEIFRDGKILKVKYKRKVQI